MYPKISSFIHSFTQQLFNEQTLLGAGNSAANKAKSICHGACIMGRLAVRNTHITK